MSDKILQTILSNTYTTDAIARRLRLLRQYVETIVYSPHKKTDLNSFLKDHGADPEDIKSMEDWGQTFFLSFNKTTLEKTIKSISENITLLGTITVFVPIQLQESEQSKIGKWLRNNVDNSVIVDVRYEPNLSVGCSLVYKGLYGDFSLKYYLRDKRDEIVKIISSYQTEKKIVMTIEKKVGGTTGRAPDSAQSPPKAEEH